MWLQEKTSQPGAKEMSVATPTLEFAAPETSEAEKEKQVSRTSQSGSALERGSQDALERKSSALQTYARGLQSAPRLPSVKAPEHNKGLLLPYLTPRRRKRLHAICPLTFPLGNESRQLTEVSCLAPLCTRH